MLSLIGAGEGRRALDAADVATCIGRRLDADELDISTDLPATLDRTHFRYFTQRMIKELLTDAGFSIHQTTVSAVHLELD